MMMGLGLLVPIAVVVVLAYAFGWLPQHERQNPPQEEHKRSVPTALDILEQRYARELDRLQIGQSLETLRFSGRLIRLPPPGTIPLSD